MFFGSQCIESTRLYETLAFPDLRLQRQLVDTHGFHIVLRFQVQEFGLQVFASLLLRLGLQLLESLLPVQSQPLRFRASLFLQLLDC